jgi:hypothetical protein
LEDQVTGDFKDEVADEEESGAKPVNAVKDVFIHAEGLAEVELGESDVDAVNVSYDVADEEERQESESDFAENVSIFHG